MDTWGLIGLLIGVGIVLILLEIVLVPGTTIVGIMGFVATVVGIVMGFSSFGVVGGGAVLFFSAAITGGGLWYALKRRSWERFALHERMEGRMNDRADMALRPGMVGTTRSVLRPYGKAEFRIEDAPSGVFEVFAPAGHVDERTQVRVVRVEGGKVTVERVV
ncbi:MAG: hypothetical protein WBA12_05220 [Catalinimonas sp.]